VPFAAAWFSSLTTWSRVGAAWSAAIASELANETATVAAKRSLAFMMIESFGTVDVTFRAGRHLLVVPSCPTSVSRGGCRGSWFRLIDVRDFRRCKSINKPSMVQLRIAEIETVEGLEKWTGCIRCEFFRA
jgi:hypothetical protein